LDTFELVLCVGHRFLTRERRILHQSPLWAVDRNARHAVQQCDAELERLGWISHALDERDQGRGRGLRQEVRAIQAVRDLPALLGFLGGRASCVETYLD